MTMDTPPETTVPTDSPPETTAEEEILSCENTLPLVQWVTHQQQDPDACVPCDLAVITPWYRDELMKDGFSGLAQEVDALAEAAPADDDPRAQELYDLHVAETLDRVRGAVDDEDTRARLDHFDCMMQQFAGEESEAVAEPLDSEAVPA